MVAEPITQEKAPKFTAVPIAEIPQDAKPDSAPKRRGRPPRDPNAPVVRRGRKRSMEAQIGSALVMANMPLMLFATNDALDNAEIEALAKALDAQAQSSPRFRKYLETALEATSGGQLATVGIIIIARRMARHEFLLPKAADAQLGSIIGSVASAAPMPVTDAPEVESVGSDG